MAAIDLPRVPESILIDLCSMACRKAAEAQKGKSK